MFLHSSNNCLSSFFTSFGTTDDRTSDLLKLRFLPNLRMKNAAKQGTQSSYGPKYKEIGFIETLEAAKNHEHYQTKLENGNGRCVGRGVASGFWFNIGGESSATVNIGVSLPGLDNEKTRMIREASGR